MTGTQLLNGTWEYRIGRSNANAATVTVPFSTLPVGHSECTRRFDCDMTAPRTFLRLDGINYHATITLNGQKVGDMLPYCTYIFNITDTVLPKNNVLTVALEDITPVFGPSEGWENYGGIPRDVMLLYREEEYITDVVFSAKLTEDYTQADMSVAVKGNVTPNTLCRITLMDGRQTVLSYEQAVGSDPTPVRVPSVHLWSPETPYLYTLITELWRDGRLVDQDSREVGFREFSVGAKRFFLNGKPLFLTGVCYHELYGTAGHLVPPEQTEKDFRMIKSMGCNYVRLVHYPHNIKTLELADRLGLLVSEEPGLWWSDTSDPEIHDGSIEVLRRTIRRDVCHPSIAFWLCFNECKFTAQYLIDSANACREADPTRPVSGANCMSLEDTPVYFKLCGFDFYTMHPYDRSTDRLIASVKALQDKPLMFTEWGGYYVTDNPQLFEDFVDTMTAFWRNPDTEDVLTGASYWCFADMYEFNRRRPAVRDGVLREGLVDTERHPNMVFDAFCRSFARLEQRPVPEEAFACRMLSDLSSRDLLPLPIPAPENFDMALTDCLQPVERYVHSTKRNRLILVGPRLSRPVDGLAQTPWVIAKDVSLSLPVNKQVAQLTLTGGTASKGYPIGGDYGEIALTLTLSYEDGGSATVALGNGTHLTTLLSSYGPSRIRPVAEQATPCLAFSYDKNHENYLLQSVTVPADSSRKLSQITLAAQNGYCYLLYAVAAR